MVDTLPLSQQTGAKIKEVYEKIARAEAEVHGREMTNIHFHELGTMDALADITAVCLMMEKLSPERVTCSPVCTGYGTVSCAHGLLPVPAPATALLLRGVPVFPGEIPCEMCTPTGAALLTCFAGSFGTMPAMTTQAVARAVIVPAQAARSARSIFRTLTAIGFRLCHRPDAGGRGYTYRSARR